MLMLDIDNPISPSMPVPVLAKNEHSTNGRKTNAWLFDPSGRGVFAGVGGGGPGVTVLVDMDVLAGAGVGDVAPSN